MQVLTDADKAAVEKGIDEVVKAGQRFERVVVSRDEALAMFQENKFKVSSGRVHHGFVTLMTSSMRYCALIMSVLQQPASVTEVAVTWCLMVLACLLHKSCTMTLCLDECLVQEAVSNAYLFHLLKCQPTWNVVCCSD